MVNIDAAQTTSLLRREMNTNLRHQAPFRLCCPENWAIARRREGMNPVISKV